MLKTAKYFIVDSNRPERSYQTLKVKNVAFKKNLKKGMLTPDSQEKTWIGEISV